MLVDNHVSTLEVCTVASCSVRCKLCPQDVLKAAYPKGTAHRLTIERFATAIRTVPPDVRIHFSGFVEPWLNPHCTQMLALALSGHRVAVYTTCVGMANPPAVAEMLNDAKDRVDVVCVHLADGEHMPAQPDADPHTFIDALRAGGIEPEVMMMSGPDFAAVDRAGNLIPSLIRRTGPIGCSYSPDYSHNVMLPNGDVHLCCQDYGLKHKLGNLFTETWTDIMQGEALRMLRASNERDDGGTLCRRCHGSEQLT